MLEKEESGRPRSGAMEMPASERPDAEGGATEHGHGAMVIFV
jgi:hypothetical protein